MVRESYNTTLIFWPATPLAASVAEELRSIDVQFTDRQAIGGWVTPYRTEEGELLLEITGELAHGLTDLEAVLATLRLADVSYIAWDTKKSDVAGTARAYDPASRVEREFTVMPDGEPVLTASDLQQEFEGRFGTAEGLLEGIQAWLRPPLPENLSEIGSFTVVVKRDEPEEDDHEEPEDVRTRIAKALDDAQLPSVAADVRDGLDLDTVVSRIRSVMNPEDASEPIAIIENLRVTPQGGC